MANYDFSKLITFQNAGTGGQYGYVDGLPVLDAAIADQLINQYGGYVQGDTAGKADNSMGWDTGSIGGVLTNGAGVFGIRKQIDDPLNPSQYTYTGDMNAAAKQLGIDPSQFKDVVKTVNGGEAGDYQVVEKSAQDQLFDAINNAAKDIYLVSGKTGYQAGGVGETKDGLLQTAAIPGAKTNHAAVLYRKEGDALVPISGTAKYFNAEMQLDPGSFLGDLASTFGPIASIAAMASGNPEIAALISGGTTAATGGDIGDVLKSVALTYGPSQIVPGLSEEIGNTTGLSADASRAIASGLVGTGTNIASGKDLNEALLRGTIGGATGYAGNSLFSPGANAGDALSTVDQAGNNVQIFDDGSTLVSDKNWMPISGTDILGNTFDVTNGVGKYTDDGSQLGGTPETNFGGNLADLTDTQNLLNYNAANTTPIDQGIGKTVGSAVNKFLQGLIASGNKTTGGLNSSSSQSGDSASSGLSQLSGLGTQKLAGMALPNIGDLQSTTLKPMVAGDNLGTGSKTPGVVGGLSDTAQNVSSDGGVYRGNRIHLYGEPVSAKTGGVIVEDDNGNPTTHVPEFFSEGGLKNTYVKGDGDGTSDDVPAMLANGEFVIPADVVSGLGNGSNDAGAKVLNEFLTVIRTHKRKADAKHLPADSKGPLAYLLEAKKKV